MKDLTERIWIAPDGSVRQVEMTSCGLNGGPLVVAFWELLFAFLSAFCVFYQRNCCGQNLLLALSMTAFLETA